MSESTNYLTCKRVKYYSLKDKEAFFEWVRKLEWIHDVTEANGDVIIDLCSGDLDQFDLLDLIAILRRYKVDMKQLQKLVNPSNRRWIMQRGKYWYKEIFRQSGPIIKNGLMFGPLHFYSPEDKEFFLDWVQAVRHLESYRLKKDVLYANLYSNPITDDDLKNLIGIFKRYDLDNADQLRERFGTKENQHLFDALVKNSRAKV